MKAEQRSSAGRDELLQVRRADAKSLEPDTETALVDGRHCFYALAKLFEAADDFPWRSEGLCMSSMATRLGKL